MKKILSLIGGILSQKLYFGIFAIASLANFLVLYKFTLSTVANQKLSILILMTGVNYVFLDFLFLGTISLLFGIFLSLMVYKIKIAREVSRVGFFGTAGLTIGLFSAGCPTCGAFLFTLIGMPLALLYFPFGGLELKLLSIFLIGISIFFLSKSLIGCKIKPS